MLPALGNFKLVQFLKLKLSIVNMVSIRIFALYTTELKMKHAILLILCFFSIAATSQSMADKVLKEARNLNAQYKEVEALAKYKQVLGFDLNNYEALWNCSLLSSKIGRREADKAKQKALYLIAKSYADKAMAINANDVQSNFVMAVAMGRIAQISETKEKIAAVRDIKKYAERAVELGPKHAAAHHLLAMWNYEVSELNWVERQAADKFFGGLPEASKEKALTLCKKALELDPDYMLYQFDLGRIYKASGDKANAKIALTRVGTLKVLTPSDPEYVAEAKKLLEGL